MNKILPAVILLALAMFAVPSFAATVNVVPNPSYELTKPENATQPLDWYQCSADADSCSSNVVNWKNSFSSDAIDGVQSLNVTDDANGEAASSVSTAHLGYNLSGEYNFSAYWNDGNNTDDFVTFWIKDLKEVTNQVKWYFEIEYIGGNLNAIQCIHSNSTVFENPVPCIVENLTGGWHKISLNLNQTVDNFDLQFTVQNLDNDGIDNYVLFDNVTLTYEQAAPPVVAIQNPTNTTYGFSFDLNFTATSTGTIDQCWWSNDGGNNNNTLASCGNTTVTNPPASTGSETITVYANDTLGNIGSSSVNISWDRAAPLPQWTSPPNFANITTSTLTATWSVNEPVSSCSYQLDSNPVVPINCSNTSIFLSGLTNGLHGLFMFTTDLYGNNGQGNIGFNINVPSTPTGMVTGATAAVYLVFPILLGLVITLAAIAMLMSGQIDVKDAAVMIIIGIIMIIAATSVMASFL